MRDTTDSNGLERAENILVWGSVAGTLVAVVAKQAVYATAPMALALLLNLNNRHRFEQKLENHITAVVSKTTFDPTYFERQVEELKTALIDKQQATSEAMDKQELEKCKQEIQELQRKLSSLDAALQTSQEQQQIELSQSTQSIQQQLSAVADAETHFDSSHIEQQIQELQASVTSLNTELQTSQEQQQIELRQSTQSIQQQLSAVADAETHFDSSHIEQQIQELQASVTSLNTALQTSQEQQQIELRQIIESVQKVSSDPPAQLPFDPSYLEQENREIKAEIQFIKQKLQEFQASSQEFNSEVAAPSQSSENITQPQQMSELKQETDVVPRLETEVDINKFVAHFRGTDVARSRGTELENRKRLSVEALMAMARSNGIGEEFQQVLEVAKRYKLGLISIHTKLMFTITNDLVSTVPSNYSRCLFIVSAQPTDAGEVQIWVSPRAITEFYPAAKETVTFGLGDFDGWREMNKAEVEEFVASLNRLFAVVSTNSVY